MSEPTDPSIWSTVGVAIGMALTGAVGWFGQRYTNRAAQASQISQHNAVAAEAEADGTIYRRLLERVDTLERDYSRLNKDLDAERRLRRALEDHVARLERMLAAHNIPVPTLVPEGAE